jgi:hypothetical protein
MQTECPLAPPPIWYVKPRDAARFHARIEPQPGGCVFWRGPLVRGVPNAFMNGERLNARRVAWYLAHGEVPGQTFLTCPHKLCVAVAHIRLSYGPCVLAMLDQGEKPRHIARLLGVDPSWVSRLNRRRKAGRA